ncbi:hypothetical protein [Tautonia plasticadhaerens]|uniref:NfeD-like C-terminal domain-containing protein n=1 Tax=Tautonia plasticadhaerens TaxID=2527974 RepID=A0A518HCU2_9BACT|nr:hypothetical protein [Tautonia plasticadhaerens]QDV38681.1 hypothetical protein ElP_66360 [Tautonia plasticadhaerens]
MGTFFLICAAIGGTILVLQLGLTLLGLGGDLAGADAVDLPDLPDGDGGDGAVGHEGAGFSDLARKLTFQAVVSFLAFFGIGGLSARGSDWSPGLSLATATAVGLAATALLGYAFGGLRKLQGSGSLRLSNAVGEVGRVYLRVPGGEGGVGKVIVTVQGRSEELRAVTPGPELRAGEAVVVTRVVDDRTLEVVDQAAHVAKSASLAD